MLLQKLVHQQSACWYIGWRSNLQIYKDADMAELADALVLGTSGLPVQVQVLLSAFRMKYRSKTVLFLFYRDNILLYS